MKTKNVLISFSLVAIVAVGYVFLADGVLDHDANPLSSPSQGNIDEGLVLTADQHGAGESQGEASKPNSHSLNTGDLPEHFKKLIADADAGDIGANYQVGKTLWQCRNVPLTVDDFNLTLSELPESERPPQANYNVEVERINTCLGVPRDYMAAGAYYKTAADSGHPDAIYEYATILPFLHDIEPESADFGFSDEHVATLSELDELSIEYLLEGATQGDLRSAVALAAKYQYGFEAFVQGDRKSLRQPDLMRAYAWYYAANIAQGGAGLKEWKTSVQERLQESGLVAEAQALGQEYFESYLQDTVTGVHQ